jgi:hypothetical protein
MPDRPAFAATGRFRQNARSRDRSAHASRDDGRHRVREGARDDDDDDDDEV